MDETTFKWVIVTGVEPDQFDLYMAEAQSWVKLINHSPVMPQYRLRVRLSTHDGESSRGVQILEIGVDMRHDFAQEMVLWRWAGYLQGSILSTVRLNQKIARLEAQLSARSAEAKV